MSKKKCKCGNDKFTLEVRKCDGCENNGAFDEDGSDEYVYDTDSVEKLGLARDQADQEGECAMGTCYGFGCWYLTCTECGKSIFMPLIEE